jgi:Flp pilus assembly protein TadD
MEADDKLQSLQTMADQEPDDPLIWFMLGSELLRRGLNEEALGPLQRCLELNPDQTAAWRLLGDAHRRGGAPAQARQAYEAAIEVAERTGDLQVAKEARAFLSKLKPKAE